MRCCQNTETKKLERAFRKLDVGRTGRISLRRVEDVLQRVDVDRELSSSKRRRLLNQADRNRDGYVDFDEFVRVVQDDEFRSKPMTQKIMFRAANMVIPKSNRPQVHSYLAEYNCMPPPIFMLLISIVMIAVFLYYTMTSPRKADWVNGCPGCIINGTIGPLVYNPLLKKEAWRYISYMLIHSGIEHLLGNFALQLILGVPLELVHKLWRVGPLYLAGVVMGSLLQSGLDPSVALVGASGGCYALLTAHLANVVMNWSEMPYGWARLVVIGLFTGADVGFAIYRRFYLQNCDRVSYMAHVGGACAGLLLGIVLLRNVHQLKWERVLWWVGLVLFIALLATCVVLNIMYNPGDNALLTTRCKVNLTSTP